MKKKELKPRFWLTLLLTAIVGIIMFLSVILVGLVMYVLFKMSIITGPNQGMPSATSVLIMVLIANFIVGVILTLLLGRIPLKPVNALINKLNLLAEGDYTTRIQIGRLWSRHPVAKELAVTFNKLANELEHTEVLREDFVNNFSHEFKTPIVSIAGFAKLLKKGDLSREEQEEYLNVIEEESMRLAYMATNVLNLTKVENQTILTDVTEYNMSEQVRSCILLLESKWSKKHISFDIEFDEYMIFANEELMKQVWINLIDNAIKFSTEGGVISVDIKQNKDVTSVSVANNGEFISEENKKRIFNKFYQADKSHSKEGNGVGLSIVKRVVELHEGSVQVDSVENRTDSRTVFTVEIPVIFKGK